MIDGAIHVWDANDAGSGHSAEELLATLDAVGVHGAACIHSRRDSGYDHTATLRALTEHGDRLFGVCVVPPDAEDAREQLRAHVENGFRGVRILPFSEEAAPWLAGPSGDPLWDEAGALGVPVDVILRPDQLEELRERAVRSPGTTMIVDHDALISAEDDPDRVTLLCSLAELPHVVCKMSALRHASREEFPHRDIHPMLRQVLDAFGPDRLIYGSDWPNMLADGVPYDYAIRTIDEALGLEGAERDQLFGGTAARIWKLGTESA
jgi:predicted TIM-barrel fold metal-dependent hydrolase